MNGIARNFVVDSTKIQKIQVRLFYGPNLDPEDDLSGVADLAYVKIRGGYIENWEDGVAGSENFNFLDSFKQDQSVMLRNMNHQYFRFNFPNQQALASKNIQSNYRYLANFISGTSKAKVLFKANCSLDYDWVSNFLQQPRNKLGLQTWPVSPPKTFLITQQYLFSEPNCCRFNKISGFSSATAENNVYWKIAQKNKKVFTLVKVFVFNTGLAEIFPIANYEITSNVITEDVEWKTWPLLAALIFCAAALVVKKISMEYSFCPKRSDGTKNFRQVNVDVEKEGMGILVSESTSRHMEDYSADGIELTTGSIEDRETMVIGDQDSAEMLDMK